MRNNDKKLGMGLSALLGDDSMIEFPIRDSKAAEIEIADIDPGKYQPRQHFSEDDLEDLASSIKSQGVLQPILLRKARNDRYELIAGERRYRASQRAGKTTIPAIVLEVDEKQAFEIALIENIQRSDLNPFEEAKALNRILELNDYTHNQLANKLAKSRAHITNTLRLLKLPKAVETLVVDGKLSAGHARALIGKENIKELVEKILEEGLTVRQTEELSSGGHEENILENIKRGAEEKGQSILSRFNAQKTQYLKALERDLSSKLGLRCKIQHGNNKGKITVEFANVKEMDNVIKKLSA